MSKPIQVDASKKRLAKEKLINSLTEYMEVYGAETLIRFITQYFMLMAYEIDSDIEAKHKNGSTLKITIP